MRYEQGNLGFFHQQSCVWGFNPAEIKEFDWQQVGSSKAGDLIKRNSDLTKERVGFKQRKWGFNTNWDSTRHENVRRPPTNIEEVARILYLHTQVHYIYMYVCMHGCMYVCMDVCMDVCMYVWMYVCMHAWMYVCMYVRMYVCMYAWMYVCMDGCMYVWMYVCMYVCSFVCMVWYGMVRYGMVWYVCMYVCNVMLCHVM